MWFRIWPEQRERVDLSCRVSMDQNGSSGVVTLWEMFSWHTLGSFVPTELHFSRCFLCASPSHYNQIIPAVCIAPHAVFENQIQCSSTTSECYVVGFRKKLHAEMLTLLYRQWIRPPRSGPSPGSVRLFASRGLFGCSYCLGIYIPVMTVKLIIFRDWVDW